MLINRKNILNFLDLVKWFGLRKIYYVCKNFLEKRSLKKSMVNQYLSRFIISNYHGFLGQNISLERGQLGLGLIHYSLIANNKPKNILVIGSMRGFIPAIIAKACEDINFGKVDFVDADLEEGQKNNWGGIGFWGKINTKEHFSKIGVEKRIHVHLMTSQAFAKKNPQKKYQYIYIDGDHSYRGVSSDYKLFFPKLEKDGLMLFHNTIAAGGKKRTDLGVNKFWRELKKQKINIIYPKDSGLGILQKT